MANLILGCGYLGLRVARLWLERGETVYAVTRSADRARQFAAAGLLPLVGNVVNDAEMAVPQGLRTVLLALGNDRRSGLATTDVYRRGLENAIAWMPQTLDRFVYISSTGVYGQGGGGWVNESSPCEPATEGGRASLAAERVLQGSRFGNRSIVLRMAGLYGPGRLPRGADLIAGRPIAAAADGWLNLIHIDDAAQIVVQAADRAPLPRTYVVSDGHPIVRRDFYEELARLLPASAPQFVPPPAESSAGQRATSDKRVSPQRLFAELKLQLKFPDYRAGLAAIVASSPTLTPDS
jgi:nucleoside-diphosphate-sugar epimerase